MRILITLITFAKQTELRGRTNDLELETITERGAILGKLVHTLVALQCKYAWRITWKTKFIFKLFCELLLRINYTLYHSFFFILTLTLLMFKNITPTFLYLLLLYQCYCRVSITTIPLWKFLAPNVDVQHNNRTIEKMLPRNN